MISVCKPKYIPKILLGRGVAENLKNCNLYEGTTPASNRIKLKFSISSAIYNAPPIKKILRKAQFNKCCYCEKMQDDEYGEIEHYRPKLGYKSKRTDKINTPGYYWLSYTWENLFFICKTCNVEKGNIFPLEDEANRAKNHEEVVSNEKPLILNPTGTGENDPRKHIRFENEFVRGITVEGKATVEACKLDREGLNIARRVVLSELRRYLAIIIDNSNNLSAEPANGAIAYINNLMTKESQYSAMAIDFITKEYPNLIK